MPADKADLVNPDDAAVIEQLQAFGHTLEQRAGEPIRSDAVSAPSRPTSMEPVARPRQRWLPIAAAACVVMLVAGVAWVLRTPSSSTITSDSPVTDSQAPAVTTSLSEGAQPEPMPKPMPIADVVGTDPLGLVASGEWTLSQSMVERIDLSEYLGFCGSPESAPPFVVPLLSETYQSVGSDDERNVSYVVTSSVDLAERAFGTLNEFVRCIAVVRDDAVDVVDLQNQITFSRADTVDAIRAGTDTNLNVWAATNVVIGIGGPGPGGEFGDAEVADMHERALRLLDRIGVTPPVELPEAAEQDEASVPIETAVGQTANVDVVGLTEGRARALLESGPLTVDVTYVEVEAGSADDGRVLAQSPESGGAVDVDSVIELFIGRSVGL